MGWRNPPVPWRDLEQVLSGRTPPRAVQPDDATPFGLGADGGDSPAWSRKRQPYVAPASLDRRSSAVPYAELHCHSCFSFLDGSSHPEELVEEAARLGLEALALTDHDGLYGVVRFAEAAREVGLPTVFGAELTLDRADPRPGQPDPDGSHLVVLARDPAGYAALARVITEGQLAGEKGAPRLGLADIGRHLHPGEADHLVALTGCRKGAVPQALVQHGPAAAARELARLVEVFGRSNVAVELWDWGDPTDGARNDALVQLAVRAGVDLVATGNVHYATPADRRLATAMAAVRARRSLDELEGWLPAGAGASLRSGAEQARRFARYPGVVERAGELGRGCTFDLALVAPNLPPYPCPDGLSEMGFLRRLVEEGGRRCYGPRHDERVPGAWAQLDHELDLIETLGFPGYFLVVWDIVEFCRRQDIYCQGRGSAANSAVCYVLGITKADAVSLGLLFERFLAPERDGPPDIDLDIESDRREEAIQYVYERHGRRHAAQVANVITYRARSSVRDAAKALGYAPGQQDAFAKAVDRWSGLSQLDGAGAGAAAGRLLGQGHGPSPQTPVDKVTARHHPTVVIPAAPGPTSLPTSEPRRPDDPPEVPDDVVALARRFEHQPRHLGIHSGGMVMCDRPVSEVCPVEWGRMADRTVLQWDKDDCAAAGLVKFDLLGLGMLSALHYAVDLIASHHGVDVDLARLPQEDAVYAMLCRADSIGVFQVESRAQMATLPRLKPRTFYDLVVEVALIRPGPIQGGSVHPYIRRRNGVEPVTYLHPLLEPALAKTLGVPLFQEQLMQMAMDVAGFTAAEADQLRQAMGSKRSRARMERLRARLYEGMAERGVTGAVADEIWEKLLAFASYGFPESHSISFAYLVYASSWIKLHYPAAFCAALLNAQPMGFYSPHSLVQDARRHGVPSLTPDVNASASTATLEWCPERSRALPITVAGAADIAAERHDSGWAVRLGLRSVRNLGDDLADRIAAGRPYTSIEDVARRSGADRPVLEALATAGAFGCFESGRDGASLDRRRSLWTAGAVAGSGPDHLDGIVTGIDAPPLPSMTEHDEATADLWATGVAPEGHPTRFLRDHLSSLGVLTAAELSSAEPGSRVLVGGVVTHRQRPATAEGTTFVNLEDETGFINVVVSVGCWARYRPVVRSAPALLVRGRLERAEGVVNVVADKFEPLPVQPLLPSRDFR